MILKKKLKIVKKCEIFSIAVTNGVGSTLA